MPSQYVGLPVVELRVDASRPTGPFEPWRHTLGHGGVNSHPLPDRVVQGARKLKPRLVRTFLQEYLRVYPRKGRLDWTRIDPYLKSLADTGARVVAALTIKPAPLFPKIDQKVWQPTDDADWQRVIEALVHRYSVERPWVTHWEVGNETDIGEWGGCPYLIETAEGYFAYYRTVVTAVLKAFPQARVGGPALANGRHDMLPGFVALCRRTNTPLDFVSWHCYNDDPQEHARLLAHVRKVLAEYPGTPPETFVTEWNKGFDPVSLEEMAFEPGRAAHTAAAILALMDAGLDWSFYYHVWDQTCYREEFEPFFHDPSIMTIHWNEIPHRFGLFGVSGEVRPQYYVYRMLGQMGEERLGVDGAHEGLHVCAARGTGGVSVLLANYRAGEAVDAVSTLRFAGLAPGRKTLAITRIDRQRRWNPDTLELLPAETREVDTAAEFRCQVSCPGDSVTLVRLIPVAA